MRLMSRNKRQGGKYEAAPSDNFETDVNSACLFSGLFKGFESNGSGGVEE